MLPTSTFPYFLLGSSLLIILTLTESHAEPHFQDLEELTSVQRASLQKLKTRVLPILPPHDFMKEDIFLVQFLIAQRYDARRAETMLKTMLKWREDNKVDNWIKDPNTFADIADDHPVYTDAYDRTGRPIFEAFFGEWDIRAAAVSGKLKHLINLVMFKLLVIDMQIREQQAQRKNVTEWIGLINLEKFTIPTGGCPACLPLYVSLMQGIEQYFPNSVYRIILVNTPSSFIPIVNLVRPIMSPKTRKALKIFDSNKAQWMTYVHKLIDPSEISEGFGGHKKRDQDS